MVHIVYTGSIITISICDMLGNEVINTAQKDIDVSTLAAGVYFVQVKTADKIYSTKLIKE
jgi:hypothetical protein